MPNVSFGNFADPEEEAIKRNRALAEALRGQSLQVTPTEVAPGGLAVPNQYGGIAKIVQALAAKKMDADADTKQTEYADKKRKLNAEEVSQFIQALRGTPATPETQGNNPSAYMPPQAAAPGDPAAAMGLALGSRNPALQQAGATMLSEQVKPKKPIVVGRSLMDETGKVIGEDSTWRAEQELAREAKKAELQAKIDDAKASREERLAAQREMQALNAKAREDMIRLTASLRTPPQQPQPQIVTTPEGVFQVDRSGKTMPLATPDGTPLSGKPAQPPGKALPVSAAGKLMENNQNLRRAEQALALMEGKDVGGAKGDAEATGWKGYVPDAILQRADKKGIDARAAIGDLGSLVIHDRSGAAVTAAEFPRLRPFIPQSTDDPATVKKKLNRFVSEYKALVDETTEFYKGSGYNVPDLMGPAGVKRGSLPAAPAGGGYKIIGVK